MTDKDYDAFSDLLTIMDEEDLIRWKKRCKMHNREELVKRFTDEMYRREMAPFRKKF